VLTLSPILRLAALSHFLFRIGAIFLFVIAQKIVMGIRQKLPSA
jgi:hypothetical protein